MTGSYDLRPDCLLHLIQCLQEKILEREPDRLQLDDFFSYPQNPSHQILGRFVAEPEDQSLIHSMRVVRFEAPLAHLIERDAFQDQLEEWRLGDQQVLHAPLPNKLATDQYR